MDLKFSSLNKTPQKFFNILPQEWQEIIVPQWKNYKNTASIFVFKEKGELIAGGIIFEKSHPNMTDFEKEYQFFYEENYFYIGFVWVIPEKRNHQLATKWLTKIKEENKNQKYWLTVEDESLKYFYEKNAFKLVAESKNSEAKEWIFTFKPS
tara:strand:+ start:4428 stop:4883 length:456 start_codon:yes stop_codon:yes gene_type:complete